VGLRTLRFAFGMLLIVLAWLAGLLGLSGPLGRPSMVDVRTAPCVRPLMVDLEAVTFILLDYA
jgi:hypothetical protein